MNYIFVKRDLSKKRPRGLYSDFREILLVNQIKSLVDFSNRVVVL